VIYTTTKNGYAVTWTPDETELATQALDEIAGEPQGADISSETARQVQMRFKELHVQRHGDSSRYSEVIQK